MSHYHSKKPTVATRTLLFTKIIAAIPQYLTAAVVLGGQEPDAAGSSALVPGVPPGREDLEAARTTVTAKKQARDAALAAVQAVQPDLQKYLAATYGEQSTTYAAFGLPVTKKPVKTAEEKAEAAAKAKATRKAHKAAATSTPAPARAAPRAERAARAPPRGASRRSARHVAPLRTRSLA